MCSAYSLVVFSDETPALSILAKYHWVHPDISAGVVHDHEGKGILCDLEYAKIMGSGGTREVITVRC